LKKEKFFFDEKSENDIGYAQALKVGNTIYVSGTVGTGTMDQSVKSVYNDLLKTLEHYGAAFSNVVKENVFTTDLDAFKKFSNIRNSYYAKDFPSASWIQVQRLYDPSFNLEVEIVAVLKE
jgi:2-iminobutanoate/2-iminopropanoate deaminase